MSILEDLKARKVPPLRSREEMVDIVQREIFGYLPKVDATWSVSDPTVVDDWYMSGTVCHSYVNFTIHFEKGSHTFRVDRLLHKDGKKRPLILCNNFHPTESSKYIPREELTEHDVDFLIYHYTTITSDDGDFTTGIAPYLLPDGKVGATTCGKIGLWAWANMRVLDYALTLPGTDEKNVAILGHSRLGKTAMYTAMLDERIRFVFSSAAGCAGDALAHGGSGLKNPTAKPLTRGEMISDITGQFPYWFCENYYKYAEKNVADDFDQHFLLATIAPRYMMVCSYDIDVWADPQSEQLCVLAASEAWERMGLAGVVGCDHYLVPEEKLLGGHLAYFMHKGWHFCGRHTWRAFVEFIEKHKNDEN